MSEETKKTKSIGLPPVVTAEWCEANFGKDGGSVYAAVSVAAGCGAPAAGYRPAIDLTGASPELREEIARILN